MSREITVDLNQLLAEYNTIIDEARRLNYLVRDIDLQRAKITDLDKFIQRIKPIKRAAIDDSPEWEWLANFMFFMQCTLNSLKSILSMWIDLKSDDPAKAWEHLIDAQDYVSVALRIPTTDITQNFSVYAQDLSDIEKVVFPQWLYVSPGIIEKDAGICSICHVDYAFCDKHLEGMVYRGRLCQRVERTLLELNHAAMVERPHDKRCIARYISTDDGKKMDCITWKVYPEDYGTKEGKEGGRVMECIIMSVKTLDFD